MMKKTTLIISMLLLLVPLLGINVIKVGFYTNPPKIDREEISGEAVGFWADITNEIGEKEDMEITWEYGSWQECMDKLYSGEIDVMVDVAEIPSRNADLDFSSETILLSWSTIFTNNSNKFNSLLDLNNQIIGIITGSVNYKEKGGLVELLHSLEIQAEIVEFDSYTKLVDAVITGEIYGGATTKDIVELYVRSGKISTSSFWFQPIHLKYALSKNNPNATEIVNIIDHSIDDFKKDNNSIYYQALNKHFHQETKTTFPKWVKTLLALLLFVTIGVFIFNRTLSMRVKSQTKHLRKEILEKEKAQKSLLRTKEKLEGANAIKSNFLRSVSHELRTPLNAILGFSEVLINKSEEVSSELQVSYLNSIQDSGITLLKIVDDMIDASLINSNMLSVVPEEINIISFIKSLHKKYPKQANLTYKLVLPEASKSSQKVIVTDKDKLEKILFQLLDNASKFTKEGSIELGYYEENDYLTFFVKDTGIGISKDNQKAIFIGFSKADNNGEVFYQGSGLGLAIVKALVLSMQGEIWFKSLIGYGTTFYVKIPTKLTSHVADEL